MVTPSIDIQSMTLSERHDLAISLLRSLDNEWSRADDTQKWQDAHVEVYESTMSFDELVAEVNAMTFKDTLPAKRLCVKCGNYPADIENYNDWCSSCFADIPF